MRWLPKDHPNYTARWHPLGVALLLVCAVLLVWALLDRL
jgi:hypothetical protein